MTVATELLLSRGWPRESVDGILTMMQADSRIAAEGPDSACIEHLRCVGAEGETGLRSDVTVGCHRFTVDEPLPYGTDTAPNPIEAALGALAVSLQATARLHAVHQDLPVRRFRTEIRADFDMRGFFAIEGVPAGLARLEADLWVDTDIPAEALSRLGELVERCCPVYGMLAGGNASAVTLRVLRGPGPVGDA